ncbi:hypothetical protein ECE50_028930 [Chitinophaga sp. Mgbs1]|uniref:Uncharacterized protein n=1 Tax=Chitinophaga solisilvae TaxID=1233460 RepID=A0A9Q5D4J9_9BACT|nr:hypothetical protein [Chitinophaga solisilvae]
MAKHLIYQLAIVALLAIRPGAAFAADSRADIPNLQPAGNIPVTADTAVVPVSEPKKIIEKQEDAKKPEVLKIEMIKEVPKSRRLAKPIAIPIPVQVNPVRIAPPKIIRPAIRIIR